MGLSMQQVGADLVGDAGRQLRQPLQHRRAQLQGDPAGRARRRGSRPSSSTTSTSPGPDGQLIPLGAIATLERRRRAAHAQPLPAAQRGQDLAASRRSSLDGAPAACSRTRRRRSCRRATASTTRASRASCGRRAASSCPRWASRSLLIFLVLAAQFNSFRDPFVILAGSVPLAMFGALIFTFLKFAGPPGMTLRAHRGLDDDAQHLLAGRARHAGRPGREERHPDRRVRERAAARRARRKLDAVREAAQHPPAADPDDHRRHRRRPLPAHAGQRARAPWRETRSASCWSAA